jgi:diacylglycerol kinase (ATP)
VKSALVVINPVSGVRRADPGGAAEVEAARSVLGEAGFDAAVVVTTGPGHASEATRRASARPLDLVVAWGGDGTMNEVARVVAFTAVPLALVPAGSGNGLARDIGVPRDPRAALAIAGAGRPWRIDAGEVNGRLFFNVAGIGLDARIAHAFAASRGRRGLLGYLQIGTRELWRYRARDYAIARDGAPPSATRALIVAFANSRQYGSHGCIAPNAVLDDGRLELVVVPDLPLWQVARRVPAFFAGRLRPEHGLQMHAVGAVQVEAPGGCELHLDGEPAVGERSLTVAVRRRALTVMAPPERAPTQAASN